jgi:hypothetical protein
MAEARDFLPAKLICGLIASSETYLAAAEDELVSLFGPVDLKSQVFPFDYTDYYAKEMGPGLNRRFLSFRELQDPSRLPQVKLETNRLEEKLKQKFQSPSRVVNIDPGILTPAALIMATAKNFSHRIPLASGIYAHLEILFRRNSIQTLDWTYPDFRRETYYPFLLEVRKIYLGQLALLNPKRS